MIKIKNKLNNKRVINGFSIAEAMIVMLIVSIAIAAMAPMISQRTKRGGNTGCEWIVTDNGEDIARSDSNIKIGGSDTSNPNARLDIILDDGARQAQWIIVPNGQAQDILRVYKGNTIIAKINKDGVYSPSSATPSGMVAFFDLAACPTDWHEADGLQSGGDVAPDMRGYFLRAWDGTNSVNIDPDYLTRTLGSFQQDALQEHKHNHLVQRAWGGIGGGTGLEGWMSPHSVWNGDHPMPESIFKIGGVITDSTYGTARVATETRPTNVALLACVKD